MEERPPAKKRSPEAPAANKEASPQRADGDRQANADNQRTRRHEELRRSLAERYVRQGNEYRFKGNEARTAFRDDGSKLSSELDTADVVRSMVDVAELKNWPSIRTAWNSTAEFRRGVWVEATSRGIRIIGYEPTPDDHRAVDAATAARAKNQIHELGPYRSQRQSEVRTAATELAGRVARQQGVSSREVLAKVRRNANARETDLAVQGGVATVRRIDAQAPRQPRDVPTVKPIDRQTRSR